MSGCVDDKLIACEIILEVEVFSLLGDLIEGCAENRGCRSAGPFGTQTHISVVCLNRRLRFLKRGEGGTRAPSGFRGEPLWGDGSRF